MKRSETTPPFRTHDGNIRPGSIAEISHLRLGGLDQWVMIRGESMANPPLIMLHGGPGLSETGMFRAYNAQLERIFTVVYWDQRGAGKSYDPNIPRSTMTVEHFLADLDELVEHVCRRVFQTKVVIFGHSWGSGLGVLYAARFPHKVAAYVGSGQYGDAAAAEAASYAYAVAEAKRQGRKKLLDKLVAIGPPPYSAKKLMTERSCLSMLEGLTVKAMWDLGKAVFRTPEASLFDLPATYRAFRFSLDAMWDEASRINLIKSVPALQMPVFFLLGRKDHWVPPETSVAYYDVLKAPSKKLVWFEQSAHEPFVDEAAKFNTTIETLVRPIVTPSYATPAQPVRPDRWHT